MDLFLARSTGHAPAAARMRLPVALERKHDARLAEAGR
jgi:hypothetical protein